MSQRSYVCLVTKFDFVILDHVVIDPIPQLLPATNTSVECVDVLHVFRNRKREMYSLFECFDQCCLLNGFQLNIQSTWNTVYFCSAYAHGKVHTAALTMLVVRAGKCTAQKCHKSVAVTKRSAVVGVCVGIPASIGSALLWVAHFGNNGMLCSVCPCVVEA